MQSRYYNPEWGRFINADAIAGQVGELLGHNLFTYCKNNPVVWSDKTGFMREMADDGSTPGGMEFPGSLSIYEEPGVSPNYASKLAAKSTNKVWKVGNDINALTKSSKYPSWNTVKSRYWKNTANVAEEGEYSVQNLTRMSKGKAPLHDEIGVSKELHHINGRSGADPHSINNIIELWPWEHADVDPFRFYNGPRP